MFGNVEISIYLGSLSTSVCEEFVSKLKQVFVWLHVQADDALVWSGSSSGCYKVSSGYRWLTANGEYWNSQSEWRWLWMLPITEKCKVFLWLLMHNALPTNFLCLRRGLASSGICSKWYEEVESQLHCLRHCVKVREVWQLVGTYEECGLGFQDVNQWLRHLMTSVNCRLYCATLWWI